MRFRMPPTGVFICRPSAHGESDGGADRLYGAVIVRQNMGEGI